MWFGEVQDESEHRPLACKFKFYTMYEESISLLFFFLGVQFHTLQIHPECWMNTAEPQT